MILLFSGGIDSYVAWHFLGKPKTVYFDVGSRYSQFEIVAVLDLIEDTVIDDSLDLGTRENVDANIPYRNMFFAMLATTYSPVVVIAGIKDDKVLDKSESAFLNMTQCMRVIDAQKVVVHSPFWSMTKRQVVAWYMENVGDKDKLLTTISCYSGTSRYCGKCASCFRKWCALFLNDIELEFHNRELALEYLSKAKSGVYVPERNQDIREAIWRYYGKR